MNSPLTSVSTLSKFSTHSIAEIQGLISTSYLDNSGYWKLGRAPNIQDELIIKLNSIPKEFNSTVNKIYKYGQMYIWEATYDLPSIQIIHLCLKLKLYWENLDQHIIPDIIIKKYHSEEQSRFIYNKHLLFKYILELIDEKLCNQKDIHIALDYVGINYYKNYSSFNRALNQYKELGLNYFFHKSKNQKNHSLSKITTEHIAFIGDRYGKSYSITQISEELKKYCEMNNLPIVNRTTVGRTIKSQRIDIIYAEQRRGKAYFKSQISGYIEKEKPKFKLQVVEADGSRLQLAYQKEDESKYKIGYLTLYILLDVASNKVVGYSIDKIENKEMVLIAFFMMFTKYKRLPAYLRIDRSSAHTSYKFKRFIKLAASFGMKYKYCIDPQEKSAVENFYRWFPELICKQFSCYTRLSIVANSWDYKPNPDEVDKILTEPKKLPKKHELIRSIPYLIEEWNNRNKTINKHQFPSKTFSDLNYKDAIFLEDHLHALLTWRIKRKTRFSRNTIAFKDKINSGNRISYRVNEPELIIEKLQNNPYTIAWIETSPNFIYVFDDRNNFICKAYKKNKYLDDPINISDIEYQQAIKERDNNNSILKMAKAKVAELNEKINYDKKYFAPFNITTGFNSNKHVIDEIETEFIEEHIIPDRMDINDPKEEYMDLKEYEDIDNNFIKS
ncbi:DDE-type integrase/transposase/recombinase [Mangrovivirga cuniculi]|uniref:Integrase catalytic domain-containing protein n=1 Tax=Mangrovivirga cuniculi TaxID=2715131 RepID=A0A4D7JNZ3_9BACT|nr:DDE-type integrase/transposase/recombinase [Mangrovivirga cuniculi]QCK15220.1 hypothetical protein DCC35_10920 [Mangrovivirga cuniculi]